MVIKSDIAISLGPLWVIDKRLAYHSTSGTGRILDGINYDREGTLNIDGREDLPYVQPITFNDTEGWAVGGGSSGSRLGGTQTAIKSIMRFSLLISSRREFGLFERDPTVTPTGDDLNYTGTGVLEWAQKVRDAIERTADGQEKTDALLESTVSKPVLSVLREAPVSDLSWSVMLDLQIDIESICRGARSIVP